MKKRKIKVVGDVAYITLTKGYEAVIDAEYLPLVENHNWSAKEVKRKDGSVSKVYAHSPIRRVDGKWTTQRLHKIILPVPEGYEVDHEDGDGLNCRKGNLRQATHQQNVHNQKLNIRNKSGYRGVSRRENQKIWVATIALNGKNKNLGNYDTPEQAYSAYCKASKAYHGNFGIQENIANGTTDSKD